jgi:hypothetical protein
VKLALALLTMVRKEFLKQKFASRSFLIAYVLIIPEYGKEFIHALSG